MKKEFVFLINFLGIFCSSVFSQPIITSSGFPENGITLKYFIGSANSTLDLSGGREKLWDLSGILPEAISDITYSNSDHLKNVEHFPESNMAYSAKSTPGDYTFLKITNEVVEYLGFVTDINGDLYVAKYNDPWILYSLPLKLNSAFTDMFACHSRIINNGDTIDNFSSGKYSYTVDGYGTLITSTKKIPNTLRVNAIISGVDSAVFVNRNDSSSVTKYVTNKVSWLSAESGNYSELVTTFDFKDYFFSETLHNNVGIVSPEINKLTLFPDPASNAITIDLKPNGKNQIDISLFNNFGNVLRVFHCDLSENNSGNWNLSVLDLPSGIYYIRVMGNKKEWGAKFVKQ